MKLAGFLLLLAVVFVAARVASARLGPVTTTHSHVVYTGSTGGSGGTGMGGMTMGTSP